MCPQARHFEPVCNRFKSLSNHECPLKEDCRNFCGICYSLGHSLQHASWIVNGKPLRRACAACYPDDVWIDDAAGKLVQERNLRGWIYFTEY